MTLNCADFYDAELARYNARFCTAAMIGVQDNVLDIGCGAGQTSREAAHIAVRGSVLGVDVSAPMLAIAHQRSTEEGLCNVVFEQGDAQSHAFPASSFDLCISRFGVMFFADPSAAFTNIALTMRPGARLVWNVWQTQDHNPWSHAVRQALAPCYNIPAGAGTAFSLGNPDGTRKLLRDAGFTSIDFVEMREPVFYGAYVDSAYDALISLQFSSADTATDEAKLRLREMLHTHLTPQGVLFDSRAWIITSRRAAT